jgi:hypothetical protein
MRSCLWTKLGILSALSLPFTSEALVIYKTEANLSKAAEDLKLWSKVKTEKIELIAQPAVAPRPKVVTTEAADLQALTDGKWIAFRMTWKDSENSEGGKLGTFSDGVALQFPVKAAEDPPSIMMGDVGNPVHIIHWKNAFQHDAEKGMKRIKDIYPNMAVDMYPMEYHNGGKFPKFTKEQVNTYSHGRAAGNPQASPKLRGVDEIFAEGFGSSQVIETVEAYGKGNWEKGRWSVVIARPLETKAGSKLDSTKKNFLGVAIWQGGKHEVGARKSLTINWIDLEWEKRGK